MISAARLTQRFDLPLETTAASRFLAWIVAGFLYVAVLALALAAVADRALELYGARAKLVTVTLPSVDDAAQTERDLEAALQILRQTRGVIAAHPVPSDELEKLVEPWLGDGPGSDELPLPRLIDVSLDPSAEPDLAALQDKLHAAVPRATLGVEALSTDRGQQLAAFFRLWGSAAGVLALLGALLAVALITRTSIGMVAETVELLRLMGARDGYLARQFERHALLAGLRGGLAALVAAALTVLALLYSSGRMELAGTIELGLRPVDWALLACVPLIAALLIMAVVRMMALWRLSRMA